MSRESPIELDEQSEAYRLPITAIIATKNEEANIARCLRSLVRVHRTVMIDSGSTDGTRSIARQHGAEIVNFEYSGGYPKKRQWALDHLDIATPWTMPVSYTHLDVYKRQVERQRGDGLRGCVCALKKEDF